MNALEKEQIVTALRSGTYKQGTRFLTRVTPDGELDCCLGVICKLFAYPSTVGHPSTVGLRMDEKEKKETLVRFYDDAHGTLPGRLAYLLDIAPAGDTMITDRNYELQSLAEMNDAGLTFAQIADVIDYVF